jgi:predicted TIM-barrel fold metal-dependent hydrolase
MILDAHTHICPPEIREDRAAFFPGEDDFRLLYQNPEARLIGATELVAYQAEAGLDGACAFGFPWTDDGHTRLCNDYVLEAGERFPGRVLPFACVNPLRPTALAEAERCLAAGARGLGEIATYGAGLGPEVRAGVAPLAALCAEAGVPLLLHTNEPVGHAYPGKSPMGIADLYRVVKENPRTTWILAHWGAGLFAYQLLRREVDEVLERVFYDTAAGPYLYKPQVYRRFLDIVGAGRLVFGSDYPLLGLSRYRQDMAAAGLAADEVAAITGGTLARLLGLDPGAA